MQLNDVQMLETLNDEVKTLNPITNQLEKDQSLPFSKDELLSSNKNNVFDIALDGILKTKTLDLVSKPSKSLESKIDADFSSLKEQKEEFLKTKIFLSSVFQEEQKRSQELEQKIPILEEEQITKVSGDIPFFSTAEPQFETTTNVTKKRNKSLQNKTLEDFPRLLKEVDLEKNLLTLKVAAKLRAESLRVIHWKCNDRSKVNCKNNCDHTWPEEICSRTQRKNICPVCKRTQFCVCNSLGGKYPELLLEWDYEKNKMNPYRILPSYQGKVYWICRTPKCEHNCQEHKWEAKVCHRTSGSRCPFCFGNKKVCRHTSFGGQHEQVLKDWDFRSNSVDPFKISSKKGEMKWICQFCKTKWSQTVLSRAKLNKPGCIACRRLHARSIQGCEKKKNKPKIPAYKYIQLLGDFPKVLEMWDEKKNKLMRETAKTLSAGCMDEYWFRCVESKCIQKCMHPLFKTKIYYLTQRGMECPYCQGSKVCPCESFATLYPQFVSQWSSKLNGNLSPYDFKPNSHNLIWWECPLVCKFGCLHIWEATIKNRTRMNSGCPFCSHPPQKFCIHESFNFKCPDLMKDWNTEKNSFKPDKVHCTAGIEVEWKCHICGFEWKQSVKSRYNSQIISGCRTCSGKKSTSEQKLKEILDELTSENIVTFYTMEKMFPNLLSLKGFLLRYDSFIKVNGIQNQLVVETDGFFHFSPWRGNFGGSDPWGKFQYQLKKDIDKNMYATKNNMHLLRIDHRIPLERYKEIISNFFQDVLDWEKKSLEPLVRFSTPKLYAQTYEQFNEEMANRYAESTQKIKKKVKENEERN